MLEIGIGIGIIAAIAFIIAKYKLKANVKLKHEQRTGKNFTRRR